MMSTARVMSQSSLMEASYHEDYNESPSITSTPSKYFVNEAAADVPLAPRLLLPTEGARPSLHGVDDCYHRDASFTSLMPSGDVGVSLKLCFIFGLGVK